jgi:DNA-binding NarL/FixJ family response regulator
MDKITVVVDDHPIFLAGLQQLFKKQPDFPACLGAGSVVSWTALPARCPPSTKIHDNCFVGAFSR